MTPLALIRHGPTAWNVERRLQGHTDMPLSDEGIGTVRGWTVPDDFQDFIWVVSPLTRAAQTAALLGLECVTEQDIKEMNWGAWEGHTRPELDEIYGEEVAQQAALGLDLRPHDGETPRELRGRIERWLERVARAGKPAGAVTHQGVIRAVLSLATGWDMVNKPPLKLDWASVHLFQIGDDGKVEIGEVNISMETS